MPRRKNKISLSLEERIANTEAEIEKLASQIKAKRSDLKQLRLEKQAANSRRLIDAIEASGRTVDDVIAMLNAE